MKQAIERALSRVVGQPLWAVGRAASLVWFQFGSDGWWPIGKAGSARLGATLFISNARWSWTRSWGEVIVDHESDHDELSDALAVPVCCQSIDARDNGSFRMHFSDHTMLMVAVEADPDPAAEEYWRFFEPHLDTPHFIVGAGGVVT
jgi:hypothetical protein